MPRRRLVALMALALLACGGPSATQDRLSPTEMEAMVAGPLEIARGGDLPGAQRAFEALLAKSDPGQAADLLTAFGVGLYVEGAGEADGLRFRRASVPYLERAVPAAEQRFGPNHPETALALNTYADVLRTLSPRDPPREADRAYARAHAIREKALGPDNAETIFALFRLAQVKGLPSRTGGDPARIAEAAEMFRAVIRAREKNADPDPRAGTPENARLSLVEMYVANGRMAEAVATARTTELVDQRRNWQCDIGPGRAAIAAVLRERGRTEEAEAALHPPPSPPPDCLADWPFLRTER